MRRISRLRHSTACRISRTSSFCIYSTRTLTCTKAIPATPCAQRSCLRNSGSSDRGPVHVYDSFCLVDIPISQKHIVACARKKTGIFSTRTPHRPNPIGLSIARVRKVDTRNRCIYLDGIDLVDGIRGGGGNALWSGKMFYGWGKCSMGEENVLWLGMLYGGE